MRNRAHKGGKASLAEVPKWNGLISVLLLSGIDKPTARELQPEIDRIAAFASALLAAIFSAHECLPQTDQWGKWVDFSSARSNLRPLVD